MRTYYIDEGTTVVARLTQHGSVAPHTSHHDAAGADIQRLTEREGSLTQQHGTA